MRRFVLAGVIASAGLLPVIGAVPNAHAATHGCISAAVAVVASSGNPNPAGTAPCSFPMVDGDTFSGVGPFTLTCGTFSDSVAAGDTRVLTPIGCAANEIVTLDTTAGGIAAAGNVQ
jgi:hypothetical protein